MHRTVGCGILYLSILLEIRVTDMSRETVEWVLVSAPEQVREVAALAKEIWGEHYRGLLTPGQITYMGIASSRRRRSLSSFPKDISTA